MCEDESRAINHEWPPPVRILSRNHCQKKKCGMMRVLDIFLFKKIETQKKKKKKKQEQDI